MVQVKLLLEGEEIDPKVSYFDDGDEIDIIVPIKYGKERIDF